MASLFNANEVSGGQLLQRLFWGWQQLFFFFLARRRQRFLSELVTRTFSHQPALHQAEACRPRRTDRSGPIKPRRPGSAAALSVTSARPCETGAPNFQGADDSWPGKTLCIFFFFSNSKGFRKKKNIYACMPKGNITHPGWTTIQ